jgi:hypothetical protein
LALAAPFGFDALGRFLLKGGARAEHITMFRMFRIARWPVRESYGSERERERESGSGGIVSAVEGIILRRG